MQPLFLSDGDVALRPLSPEDAPLLLKWLTDPENLRYWEGEHEVFTAQRIQEDFFTEEPLLRRCIVTDQGKPIGYLQVLKLDGEACEEYEYPHPERAGFGIDQFIGEPEYRNRKLGRAFIRLLLDHLVKEEGAEAVILDPHADNPRAIRCYEACGFRKIKFLPAHELHDGKLVDCWLMEYLPDAQPAKNGKK